MIKYKIILQKDFLKNKKSLMDFYQPAYNEPYLKALKNSDLICVCIEKDKIIWWMRVITDFNRFALLVDFFVKKDNQNKWIWWNITKKVLNYLKKEKVFNVMLTTDPRHPWLVDYYKKFWFNEDLEWTPMIIINKEYLLI
ncbi:MAG: hypothetical protein ACD_49C00077G0024 [uncultured bacterium (gcode 4)]|uniref:N-acetyltransferase domain-containing protein n=1 Tax=uncultured bacterium (gcode 4) TaxID=1234023 RepID=K2AW16_9BACT|nr:MAG: hypothetical protein ACD_49C00077G0024 [uncultured bacterium (gcode 4)]